MLRKLSKLSFMNRRHSRLMQKDLIDDDDYDSEIREFNLDELDDFNDQVVLNNYREDHHAQKETRPKSSGKKTGGQKKGGKVTTAMPTLGKSRSYIQRSDLQTLNQKAKQLNHDDSSVDLSELSEINDRINFMSTKQNLHMAK